MNDALHCSLRVCVLLTAAVLFVIGALLELIGSSSLSAIGNANPLSAAIPDEPDSWVMVVLGFYFVGLAAVKCGFACTHTQRLCNQVVLVNSVLALVGSVVLLALNLSGIPILQPSVWRALGQSWLHAATNGTGANGLVGFASSVLSPDAVLYASIALVPMLLLTLLAEIYLVRCGGDRSEGKGALVAPRGVAWNRSARNPPKSQPATQGRRDTHLVTCGERSGGSLMGAEI